MQSSKTITDHLDLGNQLYAYYRSRGRKVSPLGGGEEDGGFSVCVLIDRKYVVQYFIATDNRNYFSGVSLGIGPRFIPMYKLVDEQSESRFSMENTTAALEQNLAALDDYLAGKLT